MKRAVSVSLGSASRNKKVVVDFKGMDLRPSLQVLNQE